MPVVAVAFVAENVLGLLLFTKRQPNLGLEDC